MKAVKIPKPIIVWEKERLDLILSQIAEPMPRIKTIFHEVKYQEFAAACVRLKSRGSVAKIELIQKSKIQTNKDKYLNMGLLNRLIILFSAILATLPVYAKDFGTKGHTYQIIEQPFLEMIDERLQKVDMSKEREKMTAIVRDRVNNPKAVEGIKPAIKARVFYFDPTYTLEEDAVLPSGKILHKAGTRVNPLEHMELNRRMFFIDAREKSQVKWLKTKLTNPLSAKDEPIEDRIILIGGSPFKLKEELGETHENKVYFDQHGELVGKFGIKASPAVVVQEGLQLKIEEALCND